MGGGHSQYAGLDSAIASPQAPYFENAHILVLYSTLQKIFFFNMKKGPIQGFNSFQFGVGEFGSSNCNNGEEYDAQLATYLRRRSVQGSRRGNFPGGLVCHLAVGAWPGVQGAPCGSDRCASFARGSARA